MPDAMRESLKRLLRKVNKLSKTIDKIFDMSSLQWQVLHLQSEEIKKELETMLGVGK